MPRKILHIEDAFTALQNGEERGLVYYFNQFYSKLFYFSLSITQSEATSQDIVSDVFLKLWDNRSSLMQSSHVKHRLYKMVRNDSINYLRQKRKDQQRENVLVQLMPLSEKDTLEKLIEAETYDYFYSIYSRLPEKCRRIFEMFYIERLPVKEISKKLSISVNTVKSQKQRALQLLRQYQTEQNLFLLFACLLFVLYS